MKFVFNSLPNTTTLLVAVVVAGAASIPSLVEGGSASPGVSVFENFLGRSEIDFYEQIPVSEDSHGTCKGADRIFGHVNLNRDMRDRISGVNEKSCSVRTGPQDAVEIRTSLIHRTTTRHVDRVNGAGHESVSFVFLNSNPDAHFIHGEQEIPAVAGNMVTFDGHGYHYTRINNGHVHLLGPFDSHTYEPIGCGLTFQCCGYTVTREDSCLAACGYPANGVECSIAGSCTKLDSKPKFEKENNEDDDKFYCCGDEKGVKSLEYCYEKCDKANGKNSEPANIVCEERPCEFDFSKLGEYFTCLGTNIGRDFLSGFF